MGGAPSSLQPQSCPPPPATTASYSSVPYSRHVRRQRSTSGVTDDCSEHGDQSDDLDQEGEGDEDEPEPVDLLTVAFEQLRARTNATSVRMLKKTYAQQDAVLAPPPARGMDDVAVLELALALQENKSITSLDLAHQRAQPLGLFFLLRELCNIKTLTSMDLRHNTVGSGGTDIDTEFILDDSSITCTALGDILSADDAAVKILILEMNSLSESDGSILGNALANNTSLRELRLNNNFLADTGVATIGNALAVSSRLNILDLNDNFIGSRGAQGLGKALQSKSCCLKNLHLDCNNIGVEGCHGIARALEDNNNLKVLSLWRNQIGNDGAKHLSKALAHNSSLTELNIGDNDIGDSGLVDIFNGLEKNVTLATLMVWHNSIGVVGMKVLASSLKKNIHLKNLNVHSMRGLGGGLALILADALRNNSVLETLDIGGNDLGINEKTGFLSLLRKSKVSTLRMIYGIVLTDFIDTLGIPYTADLNNAAILAILQNRELPPPKSKKRAIFV